SLVTLLAREARPTAVHPPAFHVLTADDEHGIAVAVIRAAVAVLGDGSAELTHRENARVAHPIPEIARERCAPPTEIVQPLRVLSDGVALIDVGVPAAEFRERDLESDVRFDELGDLPECVAEGTPRIFRAILRLVLGGIRGLHHLDRVER